MAIKSSLLTFTTGVAIAVLICILGTPIDAQDYCEPGLCEYGKHIACGHSGEFNKTNCPSNAARITFDQAQQNQIVHLHNDKRNALAGGKLGFAPAARMATMRWNEELAKLAALNVLSCEEKNDVCRNTETFKISGQNVRLMSVRRFDPVMSYYERIDKVINDWWNGYKNAKQSHLDSFPMLHFGPPIYYFTEMALEANTDVGCAAAEFNNIEGKHFLMTCNYATNNWSNRKTYTKGPAASQCIYGNENYWNLCDTDEVYEYPIYNGLFE